MHRVLVDKIDRNSDGKITEEELKFYIDHTQKRYIYEDVDRQWKELNQENKPSILWGEYVNRTYGFDIGKFGKYVAIMVSCRMTTNPPYDFSLNFLVTFGQKRAWKRSFNKFHV